MMKMRIDFVGAAVFMAVLLLCQHLCYCSSSSPSSFSNYHSNKKSTKPYPRLPPSKSSSPPSRSPSPSSSSSSSSSSSYGGVVAPVFRINLRGLSVPTFAAEFLVGKSKIPLNLTIDTMGRQSAIPNAICSSSPSSSSSTSSAIVPCSHPLCKGNSFSCDRIRKRCISHDPYTDDPVDLVTTQLAMHSVDPKTGKLILTSTRALSGAVVSCTSSDAIAFTSSNIAAFSPGPTSLLSQIATSARLPRKFAYCLGKPKGALFIGGRDYILQGQNLTAQMKYFPLMKNFQNQNGPWRFGQGGYKIRVSGIAVGSSTPLPIDPSAFRQGIIVGTKARYTSLVDPAYQVVRRHFLKLSNSSSMITQVPSPFPELNLCYRLPPRTSVVGGPKIYLLFEGNVSMAVEPRNYIVRWKRSDIVCLGIVSAGPIGKVSVIGTLQQEETLVEYDLEKNRVGFSEQLTRSGSSCRFFFDSAPASFNDRPVLTSPSPAPSSSSSSSSLPDVAFADFTLDDLSSAEDATSP